MDTRGTGRSPSSSSRNVSVPRVSTNYSPDAADAVRVERQKVVRGRAEAEGSPEVQRVRQQPGLHDGLRRRLRAPAAPAAFHLAGNTKNHHQPPQRDTHAVNKVFKPKS